MKNLSDRVSEAAHGVQSISMTSIPNDFFDEERDKGMVYCIFFSVKKLDYSQLRDSPISSKLEF